MRVGGRSSTRAAASGATPARRPASRRTRCRSASRGPASSRSMSVPSPRSRPFQVTRCNQCEDAPCVTAAPLGHVSPRRRHRRVRQARLHRVQGLHRRLPVRRDLHQPGGSLRREVQLLRAPGRDRTRAGLRRRLPGGGDPRRRPERSDVEGRSIAAARRLGAQAGEGHAAEALLHGRPRCDARPAGRATPDGGIFMWSAQGPQTAAAAGNRVHVLGRRDPPYDVPHPPRGTGASPLHLDEEHRRRRVPRAARCSCSPTVDVGGALWRWSAPASASCSWRSPVRTRRGTSSTRALPLHLPAPAVAKLARPRGGVAHAVRRRARATCAVGRRRRQRRRGSRSPASRPVRRRPSTRRSSSRRRRRASSGRARCSRRIWSCRRRSGRPSCCRSPRWRSRGRRQLRVDARRRRARPLRPRCRRAARPHGTAHARRAVRERPTGAIARFFWVGTPLLLVAVRAPVIGVAAVPLALSACSPTSTRTSMRDSPFRSHEAQT